MTDRQFRYCIPGDDESIRAAVESGELTQGDADAIQAFKEFLSTPEPRDEENP